MSINLIRFIENQRKRAEHYRSDSLRYRGVAYTKWSGDTGGGSIPPLTYWLWPLTRDTLSRLDGGIDHNIWLQIFLNV